MTTFKSLNKSTDIVAANPTEVTVGLWPGDTGSLTSFFTGSQAAATSGEFYFDVYDADPETVDTALQCFAVAYGHRTGGGHPTLNQDDNSTLATQAVYSQYRNLLLDPSDTQFTFVNGTETTDKDHIYVINVQRARLKERLDPGNWQLTLAATPAGATYTFIDDSGQSLGTAFGKSGQVYNVVSGSLSGSVGYTIFASGSATQGGYGLFYPSLGVIVLNPDAIDETVGFTADSFGSANAYQPNTGSQATPQYWHGGLLNGIINGGDFQARSAENIASTHIFVRLYANEFNYSNNPTFFDETDGTLIWTAFIQDPRVYVTTIGLYNNKNELLAVAKPSQPLQKAFDKEINVKVRLDF